MRMRGLLKGLCLIALGTALVVPATGTAAAHPHPRLPDRIELPNGFQPEGITISRRGIAYFGSRTDGSIYAANLRTGAGRIISPGSEGTLAIGLKIDKRKRLWVSGGPGGNARVISARTGAVLRTYSFTEAPTFVNDVILGRRAAYFTDSRKAQLYVVPFLRHGALAPQSAVRTLPLTGDWEQVPDANNANGVAITPDRRALLVVQSATGFLFRVNPSTGVATRVDLGDTLLTNGDGLLVRGRTLYVVQNRLNRVAVVKLNRPGTAGTLRRTITSPDFDVPTTVAAFKRSLYLPNARFGVANADTTAEYWVTRVRAHR
jgi:sugar lactone lactonase YvrE